MTMLQDSDRDYLVEEFKKLKEDVELIVFTQEFECQFCKETRAIVEEVSALSEKISVQVYDLVKDKEKAETFRIEQIPATVVMKGGNDRKDYGIRYFGIPSGYEFSSLIQDILMIGSGDSGLSAETREYIATLQDDLHLQVFVTPTCPYCPGAVVLAHQLAMESDRVTADMVEATEFPHLANKYHVMGVPRTVINEDTFVEGMMPEKHLLDKIKSSLA